MCTVNQTLLGHVAPPGHAQSKPHCTSADGLMHTDLVCNIFEELQMYGFWLAGYDLLGPETAGNPGKVPCIEKLCPKKSRTHPRKLKYTVTFSCSISFLASSSGLCCMAPEKRQIGKVSCFSSHLQNLPA